MLNFWERALTVPEAWLFAFAYGTAFGLWLAHLAVPSLIKLVRQRCCAGSELGCVLIEDDARG